MYVSTYYTKNVIVCCTGLSETFKSCDILSHTLILSLQNNIVTLFRSASFWISKIWLQFVMKQGVPDNRFNVREELTLSSPHVRESRTVLDSGFHAVDSGSGVLDSGLQRSGFRIPKGGGFHFFPVLILFFALCFRVRILPYWKTLLEGITKLFSFSIYKITSLPRSRDEPLRTPFCIKRPYRSSYAPGMKTQWNIYHLINFSRRS